ncbi:MAG: right-handed parallel beta-helix repeat-containing protein [Alphaproteobacteria bacterium]
MRISVVLAIVGAFCLPLLHAAPAQAQATRTWISGVGDDANPCSRTAPCKTFAGAISKTSTNGEINCLDPGGFGALTITKSISLLCGQSGESGVLVSGTNGINVVTTAGSIVVIRGIDFEGLTTGLAGISFTGAGVLHVEQCVVRGFNAGAATGISFTPNGASELFVSDSYIADNGTGTTGGGIVVAPTSGGSATVVLNRVESNNNTTGFRADGSSASSSPAIKATIVGSAFSGNSHSGINATTAGTNTVNVMINDSTSSNNVANGVSATASNATIEIGSSTISGNATGLNPSGGGQILSTGNNQIGGNTSPGTVSGSAPVL